MDLVFPESRTTQNSLHCMSHSQHNTSNFKRLNTAFESYSFTYVHTSVGSESCPRTLWHADRGAGGGNWSTGVPVSEQHPEPHLCVVQAPILLFVILVSALSRLLLIHSYCQLPKLDSSAEDNWPHWWWHWHIVLRHADAFPALRCFGTAGTFIVVAV